MTRALVVLSGGQDSTTVLFMARQECDEVFAITFDYNQRHKREITAAEIIAQLAGVKSHEICRLGPILKGRSPLTDPSAQLETYKSADEMEAIIGNRVELTFVPGRNALFLTLAANRAAVLGCDFIYTGVCEADNANYPDCRVSFIRSQEHTIHEMLGDTAPGIFIRTPLIDIPKPDSILLALQYPGCYAALGFSHTAYDGSFPPTSNDHASTLRRDSFEKAGVPDPLVVRAYLLSEMDLPETKNYDMVRNWKPSQHSNQTFAMAELENLIRVLMNDH